MVAYIFGCDSSHHLQQQVLHDQAAWTVASCVQMMSVRSAVKTQTISLKKNIKQVANYYYFIFNLCIVSQK
jgi:hypothetical protein